MRRYAKWGALVVLAGLGVVAGVFLSASSASPTPTSASRVTIRVVANEWSFKLSKRTVPAGSTVVFKVVNKGKIAHDFKIAGKKTKLLQPGKSQSLVVKFPKKGKKAYICTIKGHARLGMKGVFGVGVKAPPPTTTTTTTTVTGPIGPGNTTVTVDMVEYAFNMSTRTVPSGRVTFVIKNSGAEVHNFDLNGVHSGALLQSGGTETWTVSVPPGQYLMTCDVPFHVERGMTGAFTVTP